MLGGSKYVALFCAARSHQYCNIKIHQLQLHTVAVQSKLRLSEEFHLLLTIVLRIVFWLLFAILIISDWNLQYLISSYHHSYVTWFSDLLFFVSYRIPFYFFYVPISRIFSFFHTPLMYFWCPFPKSFCHEFYYLHMNYFCTGLIETTDLLSPRSVFTQNTSCSFMYAILTVFSILPTDQPHYLPRLHPNSLCCWCVFIFHTVYLIHTSAAIVVFFACCKLALILAGNGQSHVGSSKWAHISYIWQIHLSIKTWSVWLLLDPLADLHLCFPRVFSYGNNCMKER